MDKIDIITEIKKTDVAKLTSDMIKIPSYSFLENQEEAVAKYIYRFMQERGIDSEIREIAEGRYNVNSVIPGRGGGRSLMFCGHMDTVPAYDMNDAFGGRIMNGRIYGRGAVDMKGPMAAMMAAFAGIKSSGMELKGDLIFAALADEEETGLGAENLVKEGPFADAVIVGEPCFMDICLGHKGLEWIVVEVLGKKVHGGSMESGINAITMAARLIEYLTGPYSAKLAERKHHCLGNPTINIGTIRGGDQPSTVPDKCEIRLDRRYLPGEDKDSVYKELEDIMDLMAADYPPFKARVKSMYEGKDLMLHKPFCTDEKSSIVKAVQKAAEDLGVPQRKIGAFPAWTDAGVISGYTKSTCIVMGPGDLSLAHSAGESVDEEELKEAALIYGRTAVNFCGL